MKDIFLYNLYHTFFIFLYNITSLLKEEKSMFTTKDKTKVQELIEQKGGFKNFIKYYGSNEVSNEEKKSLEHILFFNGEFSLLAALYYTSE